ncbi:MAG: TIGR00730 family Rossman fold protein [Candidatus Uhrbacteria bacterium]|nr:TIGR00730 family Rossman fold protein [Candidatus Uhrbacteria bacterium]
MVKSSKKSPKKIRTQKTPAQLAKRTISDEGARRVASWNGAQKMKGDRRYHKWLQNKHTELPLNDRLQAFTDDPNWRIFRIMAEFIDGFEFLDSLRAEVTIFGSARAQTDDEYYQLAKNLGFALGKEGYTMVTGGGPGIMEAANWGAYEAGGESIGLDIELPTEQRRNQFVTRAVGFHHFFTRKVMLSASAQAYVFFPGGFGTLDEMSEMVTLIQTGKIPRNVPVILFGKDFWTPFLEWARQEMFQKDRYISEKDLDILQLVDTVDQAMKIIRKTAERPYGSFAAKGNQAPLQEPRKRLHRGARR